MIADAAGLPGVTFSVADAADWQPAADVDVIVSNAALQWVPNHQQLIARWSSTLPSGGWVAVQVPGNFDSPSHALMRQLAGEKRWAPKLPDVLRNTLAVSPPESYAKVLLGAGLNADVWKRRMSTCCLATTRCWSGSAERVCARYWPHCRHRMPGSS